MPEARVGKRCDFSGDEAVTCVLQPANRKGFQIVAEGFNIEDATVTTISTMCAETIVEPPEGKTNLKYVSIGKEGVTIDGLTPGGVCAVTIIQ